MEAVSLFSRFRIDVLVISPSVEILQRIVQSTERLKLSVQRVSDVERYEENFSEIGRPNVVILDFSEISEKPLVLEKIFFLKTVAPKSHFIALVKDTSDVEYSQQLKDAGVDYIQAAAEVLSSVRLDFLLMHQFLLKFYPIDLKDLFPGTEITFNAFHFMELNNKYLPVIFQRFILSDKKFKRLEKINQIYIENAAAPAYQKYIESYYDSYSAGLQKRTKAAFLLVVLAYTQIRVLMVSAEGKEAAQKLPEFLNFCEAAHLQLVNYTKSSPDPFYTYVQLYQSHDFSNFDRSLFIAGLAAFLAEMSGIAPAGIILKASLIAFSGMMYSDYMTYLKWHDQLENQWSPQDTERFLETVKISGEIGRINLADFNGPMSQAVSHIFERFDGNGLPNKVSGERIPPETALIQISDGWLRQQVKKPSSTEAYESFKTYLAIEKKSGKVNPQIIEKLEQVQFRKAV